MPIMAPFDSPLVFSFAVPLFDESSVLLGSSTVPLPPPVEGFATI
jgi:hypothetical protein